MSINVSDFVFPTGKFTMVADGQKVADFDVQRFGDAGQWPVVATIGPDGKTIWSVYSTGGVLAPIRAMREESSDGSSEEYTTRFGPGTLCLPRFINDGEKWTNYDNGIASYTPTRGPELVSKPIENGTFVYRNSVWSELDNPDHLMYWLEDYSENYGGSVKRYLRLHCYEKGKGLIWYIDHNWKNADGTETTKLVTRAR